MDSFIGEIRLFPYNFAPRDWMLCDGASLPVSNYSTLYSIIGNTYGGDFQTFNIPNLTNRVAVGAGIGPGLTPRDPGEVGGHDEVTLTHQDMPPHTHAWQADRSPGDTSSPSGNLLANIPNTREFKQFDGPMDNAVPLSQLMVLPQGSGMPHNNQQPYLAMGHYISLYGEYPQRP